MPNKLKEKIIAFIKVFLIISMMISGFWISYCFIWYLVGLPITNWSLITLYALACLTEYGYYRWVREV